MKSENLKFDVIGGKAPKEMTLALNAGFFEAYRKIIPGGFNVVLAKRTIGSIGETKSKRVVLVLDEMPPKETILGEVQEVLFVRPEFPSGAKCFYGICDGRKFIVQQSEESKPVATEPKKRKSGSIS